MGAGPSDSRNSDSPGDLDRILPEDDTDINDQRASAEGARDTSETPTDPLPLTIDYVPNDRSGSRRRPPIDVTPSDLSGKLVNPDRPQHSVPVDPQVRDAVPGYEILYEVGRGGMGVVYQARQKHLNRLVALKMILSGSHAGSTERERFRREAEAVAALQHPNIVQIFEIGEVDNRPYLAFEFVEGGSLAAHLEGQPWPARAAAELVETLARAVQFAHDQGIVHRDLKPGNVLLNTRSGTIWPRDKANRYVASNDGERYAIEPKVTDFGLAKRLEPDTPHVDSGEYVHSDAQRHTRTGAVMGTPSYIAPEQAAGKTRDVGPSADIYSLGAILYELLTGRPPFRGETPLDTVLQVMTDDPVPPRRLQPKIPRDLETICLKCLQKSPSKRYRTANELAADLRRFLDDQPIAARPVGVWERGIKMAKRHPAAAILAMTSGLALLSLLIVSFYFNIQLGQAAEREQREANLARDERQKALDARNDAITQEQIARKEKEIALQREQEAKDAEQKARKANEEMLRRIEEVRRGAYALTLSQVMLLAERDPQRAQRLLEDNRRCPPSLRDFSWNLMYRLCRADATPLHGHLKSISYLAISPDESLLASAGWDDTVRIYDLKHMQHIATLQGHQGLIRCVAFAPDGRMLATVGADRTVRLWEIPIGWIGNGALQAPAILRPWTTLGVERDGFRTALFSNEGKRLYVGGMSGIVYHWDLVTLPRTAAMALAGGPLTLVSRRPEGDVLADRGPVFWITGQTGGRVAHRLHRGEISSMAWSSDGLLTAGADRAVRVWNLDPTSDGTTLFQHPYPILAMACSPNDDLIAISDLVADEPNSREPVIRVWSRQQGKDVATLRGHSRNIYALAFVGEGRLLASASHDGTVRIWDTAANQERSVFRSHSGAVRALATTRERPIVASGGEDRTIRIWNLNPQREQNINLEPLSPIQASAISSDHRLLAEVDRNGVLKVWQLDPAAKSDQLIRRQIYTMTDARGKAPVLVFSERDDAIALASMDGEKHRIRVWNLPLLPVRMPEKPIEVKSLATWEVPQRVQTLDLKNTYLAIGGSNGLEVWSVPRKQRIWQLMEPLGDRYTFSVMFIPGQSWLVSAVGNRIYIHDVVSGSEIVNISTALAHPMSRAGIQGIVLGPGRRTDDPEYRGSVTLATMDEMGLICVWDLMLGSIQRTAKGAIKIKEGSLLLQRTSILGHMEPVTSIAFSHDGQTLATTSQDRTVRLWDPLFGQERATLTGHTDTVLWTSFLPDDSALLTLGREGILKVWPGK